MEEELSAYTELVGDWYTIGLSAGLGTAIGVLLAGLLGARRELVVAAALLAAGLGALVGVAVDDWGELAAGAAGGLLGAAGAGAIVLGASRRGGTRGGLALIVAVSAAVIAGLAFVPVFGYLAAVAMPALAMRVRGRGGERYAGLRTLAK